MQSSNSRTPRTGASFTMQAQSAPAIGDELERLQRQLDALQEHQKTTYSQLIRHDSEHATRLELEATQARLVQANQEIKRLKQSQPDALAITLTSVGASLLVGIGTFTMLAMRLSQTSTATSQPIYQERLK